MNRIIEFSETGADGQTVVLRGKIFAAGDYPDKQFSVTPADLDRVVREFRPVLMDNQHRPKGRPGAGWLDNALHGKLGTLRKVWRQGMALFGEVEAPKWLYDLAKSQGQAITVSAEWHRESKRLTGMAYALSPRISDAQLHAAFSDATPKNRATIFTIQADYEKERKQRETLALIKGLSAAGRQEQEQARARVSFALTDEERKTAAIYARRAREVVAFAGEDEEDPEQEADLYARRRRDVARAARAGAH